ncbi:MAG: thymidine phosphorylase [Clostridia bacterium]|nr:thymidine phosphorylase [Clostridia bacterium]
MRMVDLIRKKRDGGALTDGEIAWFIHGYVAGEIPDYQVSALMMAIYFRGMTPEETACLTRCMAKSGDTVDLSCFGDLSVDKHSTGGVGDKTTLILAPVVSVLGLKVAKMSGRGLGHTGGTVDKLESIPGFRTGLSPAAFLKQVEEIGVAVIGQTGDLTPADKLLYALRDVTATVESIPLIASSIMSKKLAAGTHTIVLDVKTGSGAFMRERADAEALAKAMVDIGTACGRKVAAIITDMDVPLGRAVGNALEVKEAVEVLKGGGPADLCEVCVELATNMVSLGLDMPLARAEQEVRRVLEDGTAYRQFIRWIGAQGGDVGCFDAPEDWCPAPFTQEVVASKGGVIVRMDTEKVGLAGMLLGGGRAKKEDVIDPAAGLYLHKKTGDTVASGEPLAVLYTSDQSRVEAAREMLLSAYTLE